MSDLELDARAVDLCDVCELAWPHCVCNLAATRREATFEEIELAREERLSQLERSRGAQ